MKWLLISLLLLGSPALAEDYPIEALSVHEQAELLTSIAIYNQERADKIQKSLTISDSDFDALIEASVMGMVVRGRAFAMMEDGWRIERSEMLLHMARRERFMGYRIILRVRKG